MRKFTTIALFLLATSGIISAEELNYTDELGIGYLLNTDTKTAAVSTSNPIESSVVIPSSITYGYEGNVATYTVSSIGQDAFSNCYELQSVTLPNSIVSIEMGAFRGCSSLNSIDLSNSLKSIESDAFDGCSSLQSIDLPESLNYLGPAFASCGLKTITIPNGITELLPLTFANCPYLESVTIPNTMKTIGYAFEGCSSFSIVNVLDIATWCGMTFMGDFRPTRDGMHLYLNGTEVFDLVIPSSVEVISQEVFSEFNWIKTVDISDSVTTIGEQAFYNCTGLESVKFGTGLQSIGDNAFGYCENLTSVSLPSALKDLGEYTFTYCTSLESITLPDSVEVIPEAFMRGCESLTTLTIPSNVTKIEQSAFSRTENLTTVYFPAKLKSVGSLSFEESAIKDAYCDALVPPTCATGSYATFSDTRLGNSTLHVPVGTKEAYAKADQWKLFGNIVEGSDANGIESLESDAEKCFDIIDLKGRILKHNATIEDLNSLDSDIYIINGEKKFIKR